MTWVSWKIELKIVLLLLCCCLRFLRVSCCRCTSMPSTRSLLFHWYCLSLLSWEDRGFWDMIASSLAGRFSLFLFLFVTHHPWIYVLCLFSLGPLINSCVSSIIGFSMAASFFVALGMESHWSTRSTTRSSWWPSSYRGMAMRVVLSCGVSSPLLSIPLLCVLLIKSARFFFPFSLYLIVCDLILLPQASLCTSTWPSRCIWTESSLTEHGSIPSPSFVAWVPFNRAYFILFSP